MSRYRYIRRFLEISMKDLPQVGGKNGSLGEMIQHLSPLGVKIPDGFAVMADAYREHLAKNRLLPRLHRLLDDLDVEDTAALQRAATEIRHLIYQAPLPEEIASEIGLAYRELCDQYGVPDLPVAVRSSATAEDLPEASFAGQQETFLNIRGEGLVGDAVKRCFASLFTERAIHYRATRGFDHFKVALSVGVQKLVRSDLATSGVIFTLDTESGFREVIFLTASYGLGEPVVQGAVDPDEYYVFKPTFRKGFRMPLRRKLGRKQIQMVLTTSLTHPTRTVPTPERDRNRFCLSDEEVAVLADYALKVEEHYGRPMDIEWAKDGISGELYLVQARPETAASRKQPFLLEEFHLKARGKVLSRGYAVGQKIATGRVRVVRHVEELKDFRSGEVLVADITTPDWEPAMKRAAAIVTNRGGRVSHAAIVARELGVPAVVGCGDATEVLRDGEEVTVSCAEGEIGYVYEGRLPFEVIRVDLKELPRPQTKIMLIVANPDLVFSESFLPNDGVGLARIEFIIGGEIQAHPLALLHPEKVPDRETRERIAKLTAPFDGDGRTFYIRTLAEGIAQIAAAFYPKPVIVRTSDFKSNEYAALLGGRWFEPEEENPMLGFRGAARYLHPRFEEPFRLEVEALRWARERIGLDNITVMLPFVRRVEEGRRAVERLRELGLRGCPIYAMCEIPSNVLLLEQFASLFDGFSIGSNDLTQLTLGVDRDSELVAEAYDERDEAVKLLIRQAISKSRQLGKPIGFCGQAPSDYPDMAAFLVECGIDSISLNPDAVLRTIRHLLEVEERLGLKPRGTWDETG